MERRLLLAAGVTGLVCAGQVVGGLLTGSLALLSDAAHVFLDTFALLLSHAAIRAAGRPPTDRHTYGYHRMQVLAALVNGATLAEIEQHPVIQEKFPVLAQAASSAATPQLRNMGTVGGNLCQKPRCWYYRNKLFPCWLKGGEQCFAEDAENRYHAILGADRCHAVHPSDLAPALIALDATLRVVGPGLSGEISVEELYRKPTASRRQMTILGSSELITEVRVPVPKANARGIYLKAMERQSWSFALVSVATQLSFAGERIADARIVLGGVAAIPWRAKDSEKILAGQKFSEELVARAAEAAVAGAQPLRDNRYKVPLARGLVKRALMSLARGASSSHEAASSAGSM
jgi:xanthine dehydrogenase YagS FAD-binding subunit